MYFYEKMFLYHFSPIDHGWERLPTVGQHINHVLTKWDFYGYLDDSPEDFVLDFREQVNSILYQAKTKSLWEGDFQPDSKPRVITLLFPPDSCSVATMPIGLIWKQGNNGSTFLCTPSKSIYDDKGKLVEPECEIFPNFKEKTNAPNN